MRSCLRILLILLLWSPARAQTNSALRDAELEIGEQTSLIYTFQLPEKSRQLHFAPRTGTIETLKQANAGSLTSHQKGTLEIIDKFRDSTFQKGKQTVWIGQYKVTAWDTGYYVIPGPQLVFNDSTYTFDPVLIHITAPYAEAGKDLYDIEESFSDFPDDPFYWLRKNYGWLIGGVALLLIAFILYKRRSKTPPVAPKQLTLRERTLLAIDALDAAKLWERGQIKEHHTELSFLLRAYLGARYELNFLEQTTFQTTALLHQQGLETDTIETIRVILDQSDLVKFAKSAPTALAILKISALARQVVAETSPLELDHAD
jgi:hypothetical protein